MIPLARLGPEGSHLLDLDDAGLYRIERPDLVALLLHGMQAQIYPTEFSVDDPGISAGHATLSRESEAVWIVLYRSGRRSVVPAPWLRAAVENRTPTELREILETAT